MKALQIVSKGQTKVVEDIIGSPESSQVVIEICRIGICGSDIHIYNGSNPFTIYPRIIGHEMSGRVVETGSDVKSLKAGDRVVVDPVVNCGECDACRRGHPNVCSELKVMGVHIDGGFSTHLLVEEKNLYKLPDSIDWDMSVLIEPFSIGANICTRLNIQADDRVLIVGSGVIGNVALMVVKMLGAVAIVCDIDDEKLSAAKKIGADHVINSSSGVLVEEVNKVTSGNGVTAVIDAACVPALFQSILECASPGGRIGILGFSKNFSSINQYEITRKELSIVGSRLNNRRFPLVIDWFEKKMLEPKQLISGFYSFDEAPGVLKQIADAGSNNGKTIIRVSE